MIDINSSITVGRPAGEVFDFVNNQKNAPLWLSGWLETRPTSETEGVGYTWIDVVEVFGRRVETEFEVTEFEPARKIAFKSIRGSFPVRGIYSFTPDGDGTVVTFALQGEPAGFFKLAEPLLARMLQRQWDTNLANLKDILETE
ncbi:MAG: SRPBCC family protein [Candidatus Promineifilaceae bacterium]|nr:SRPBCC family protein [Candidatus Promineifilaceae bacterium]